MKIKLILSSILAFAVVAGGLNGCATKEHHAAKLQAQARITKPEAEKLALARVPGGTIKEGELEEERGKLIYSFDISMPGTKDIMEVQVDARTGEIVSTERETPQQEAKEKQ